MKGEAVETWSDILRRIARELEEGGPSCGNVRKTMQVMNDLTSIVTGIGRLCLSKTAKKQDGEPPECDHKR
jgi:hypothetical protein